MLIESEIRTILLALQSQIGLVDHQIQSYDFFMETTLPKIVQENSILIINKDDLRYEFEFGECSIQSPANLEPSGFLKPLSPAIAKLRGLSYNCSVFVDIEQRILKINNDDDAVLLSKKIYHRRLLARLPVMLGSKSCFSTQNGDITGECPYDIGGYFIQNGMTFKKT